MMSEWDKSLLERFEEDRVSLVVRRVRESLFCRSQDERVVEVEAGTHKDKVDIGHAII